jgi:hypothetical protein
MNWIEIKEKFPLAWVKFINENPYYEIVSATELGKLQVLQYELHGSPCLYHWFPFRNLYDFFDSEGIYISVMVVESFDEGISAGYAINKEEQNNGMSETNMNSRIQAEKSAFVEAFKLLEEKLTTK